jgi:hypothetical protein
LQPFLEQAADVGHARGPAVPTPACHGDAGFNAPSLTQIRNVVIENADIGIIMDGTSFNTVQNVTFTTARPKHDLHPYFGGKGIWMKVGRADEGKRGAEASNVGPLDFACPSTQAAPAPVPGRAPSTAS